MTKKFKEPSNPIGTVAELFAGVGGFRIGLANAGWRTVFSNQWEPMVASQHASSVYITQFGELGHNNCDIATVKRIPSKFDLLVGGFPCQDYSVAKSLGQSKGLRGKKGVLWWEILRLVQIHKPKFIFLENVDRLLKSPSGQRGRDFAIMLRTLGDVGYTIEWRVVNAAEYGFPQRRIRVFIVAKRGNHLKNSTRSYEYILKSGIFARSLPVTTSQLFATEILIDNDVEWVSKTFNRGESRKSPFMNSGVYYDGIAYTIKTEASYKGTRFLNLGDILQKDSEIDEYFYVPNRQLREWKFLKGAKSIERIHRGSGAKYNYAEGSMAFPDLLSKPSRTILTGEGGTSPSRFKHIIRSRKGFRRLTPIELERLNGFPDNWTKYDNNGKQLSDTRRAFLMGNALVIGLVEKVGRVLAQEIKQSQSKT